MARKKIGFKRVMGNIWKELKRADAAEVEKKPWLGIKARQSLILVVFVAFAIFVGYHLFKFTVLDADMWQQRANSQHMRTVDIMAMRGSIYDTNGTVLAQSSTVWNIVIAPQSIKRANEERRKAYDKELEKWQKDTAADKKPMEPYRELSDVICYGLAEILEIEPDYMLEECKKCTHNWIAAKRKVEKPVVLEIEQFLSDNNIRSDCVYTEESSKRYYPNRTLASSVIGFTNFDGDGVYGLEAYYDEYLKGTDGKAYYMQDGLGQGIANVKDDHYAAIDGNSLILTLDEVLQHYVEKNLEKAVSQHKVVNRGMAIVMNCKTGGVLAMATSPSYDLNEPSELTNEYDLEALAKMKEDGASDEEIAVQRGIFRETQWKNKAVTELYFPGSVFKTITCSMGLDLEVISTESTFQCNAVETVAGQPIKCWSFPSAHGTLTLQQAITKSCNPSFIQIGQKIGAAKFSDYFEAFGFTERTGIDLPGEANSLYVPRSRMGLVELASSSFGQTNKITPIQMCTALCAAMNGGYLVTPHLVDKIIDCNGNVIETKGSQIKRQVISEETSAQMREIWETIVSQNGGTNAYIAGYRIGGKSGTTEKIDEHNEALKTDPNAKMTYVGTFAAAVPMDDPEIVMLVAMDTPTGVAYYGSQVAAPVVSATFNDALEHLGIYPTYTAEEQQNMDAVVPYVIGSLSMNAQAAISAKGFKTKIIGEPSDDAKVVRQIPGSGSTIPKGSTVLLYFDKEQAVETGKVPNVIGKNAAQANELISAAGFNIKIVGGAAQNADAKAVEQSVSPGTEANKGSVISVTFQYNTESD